MSLFVGDDVDSRGILVDNGEQRRIRSRFSAMTNVVVAASVSDFFQEWNKGYGKSAGQTSILDLVASYLQPSTIHERQNFTD